MSEADRAEADRAAASVFTDAERAYLATQKVARIGTASTSGRPDVAAVRFRLDGELRRHGRLEEFFVERPGELHPPLRGGEVEGVGHHEGGACWVGDVCW